MSYSLDEFIADAKAIPETNAPEWNLGKAGFPDSWFNSSEPLFRLSAHFFEKYGRDHGPDNAQRFFSVMHFVQKYREHLIRAGLIHPTGVRSDFIAFLLKGFAEPVAPVIFGKHCDAGRGEDLSYAKVIRRWQAIVRSESDV